MPVWLFALLGLGAGGAYYAVTHKSAPAAAGTPLNGATTKAMGDLASSTPQHIHLAPFKLGQDELNKLALGALLNPATTQAARDYWLMFTAENPYFSPGTPASKQLGWG